MFASIQQIQMNEIFLKGREKMKNKWKFWMTVMLVLAFRMVLQTNYVQAKQRTFAVNPKTIPCSASYRQRPYYNKKTQQYYMISSYMKQLSATGGTLILKKGIYSIPGTINVPSNVKIVCANGVEIKKTTATGIKKVNAAKYLFRLNFEKNASIQGNGKVVFDMGNVKGATAVFVSGASDITLSGIHFLNKKGGSYVLVKGSKNVSIHHCTFERKKDISGLKNRMAVRLEMSKKIKVESNQFLNPDIGVGTAKFVVLKEGEKIKEHYQDSITIVSNVFTNTKKAAIYAVLWNKPIIKKNVIKRNDTRKRAGAGVAGFGVKAPSFSANQISGCVYAAVFDELKNTGSEKVFSPVASLIKKTDANKIAATQVYDLEHYYVLNKKLRILYFRNKRDKNFTITTTTAPYHEKYEDVPDFARRRVYYTFMSYMEQFEYAGGGTLSVKAGDYEVTNNICIPSNVTIKLENGVTFTKSGTTATDICYAKSIFTIVPPSKDGTVKTISGYNGSHDVKIVGTGIVRFNCSNVKNCMALVMGHARNVTIEGITFQNEYGSHFVELNSSKNVTFQKCIFTGFRVLEQKSHKECINVDGTDFNTAGFNYNWSAHDKTMCKNILIQNTMFKNIGTAIGSHTYSANGQKQFYHEDVKIINNTFEGTYNAAIRALNWKDTVISGNRFLRIQALSDGKGMKYVALLLRGVVNPMVTGNVFKGCEYYPIRVVLRDSASVPGAVKAGYGDTISSFSDENQNAMKKNTLTDVAKKYHYYLVRENNDQPNSKVEKKRFCSN